MAAGSLKDSLTVQASILSDLSAACLEPTLERYGLTLSGFEMLSALKAAGGECSQAELARRLGIQPPSLSEAVRTILKTKLVESVRSEEDARLRLVRLTELGRTALEEVLAAMEETNALATKGIPTGARETALEVLKTATRNLAKRLE